MQSRLIDGIRIVRRIASTINLDRMDVGEPDCPALRRWRFTVGDAFSIRLHRWLTDDPPDYQHSHAWPFLTVVLKGGYRDITPHGSQALRAGQIVFRPADHRHAVVDCVGCWTLVLTGRAVRPWMFWIGERQVDPHEWNTRVCD